MHKDAPRRDVWITSLLEHRTPPGEGLKNVGKIKQRVKKAKGKGKRKKKGEQEEAASHCALTSNIGPQTRSRDKEGHQFRIPTISKYLHVPEIMGVSTYGVRAISKYLCVPEIKRVSIYGFQPFPSTRCRETPMLEQDTPRAAAKKGGQGQMAGEIMVTTSHCAMPSNFGPQPRSRAKEGLELPKGQPSTCWRGTPVLEQDTTCMAVKKGGKR